MQCITSVTLHDLSRIFLNFSILSLSPVQIKPEKGGSEVYAFERQEETVIGREKRAGTRAERKKQRELDGGLVMESPVKLFKPVGEGGRKRPSIRASPSPGRKGQLNLDDF